MKFIGFLPTNLRLRQTGVCQKPLTDMAFQPRALSRVDCNPNKPSQPFLQSVIVDKDKDQCHKQDSSTDPMLLHLSDITILIFSKKEFHYYLLPSYLLSVAAC